MRLLISFALFALVSTLTFARLGETEAELFKRFGMPITRSHHVIFAQGQMLTLGPTFMFKQEGWNIQSDMIDGRCMRIHYSKPGDWTEDQIQLVLNSNGQGAKWAETTKPAIASLQRTWKRIDGSSASWQKGLGMSLVWSAYEREKSATEERARVESAIKKPKI